MKHIDYEKLGLLCGLEIHQQLEGRKLFSCAPTIIRDDKEDFSIERSLTAVAGETGEIDVAASAESQKNKRFIYKGYTQTVSLVEIDEQPPLPVNQDALFTTLQLAGLLDAVVVDEIHVMRKTVVDGSNTSGFQRTALVAYDGTLRVDGVTVGIPTICLEEDSAKIIERTQEHDIYNLSRLGIPLIEISTTPVLTHPSMVHATALKIGMLLRSTGRVKRGLGTIRQDVNVSISKGSRVEIKGAQDLALLSTLVANEAFRQNTIVELRDRFCAVRVETMTSISALFSTTASSLVSKALAQKQGVFGARLTKGAGLLGTELQPGKRVGTDLSDFAKTKAKIGGIIHSDEPFEKYGFIDDEIIAIKKSLACRSDDAFIMVVAPEDVATQAFSAIAHRLTMLAHGVPSEVRKANDDGTTTYLRPMPGASRMYPETDVWPLVPPRSAILPELIEDKIVRYQREFQLAKDLAETIATGSSFLAFEHAVVSFPCLKPATIAEIIASLPVTLKRKHGITGVDGALDDAFYTALFKGLSDGKIATNSLVDIARAYVDNNDMVAAMKAFSLMDPADVKHIVTTVVKELGNSAPRGKLIGEIMRRCAGKADGKLVQEFLDEVLR